MEVQVIEFAENLALPGKCYHCGYAGNDRRYIDMGVQIEFYGAQIYCELCMSHYCNLLGFMSPEIANDLREENVKLTNNLDRLQFKYDAILQGLNSLKVAEVIDVTIVDNSRDSESSLDLVFPDNSEFVAEVLSEREESVELGETGSSESGSIEGLADLSSGEDKYDISLD